MGLGPFELVAPLGQGGMGEVWRAVHATQGSEVAIKLLAPRHRLDDGRVQALLAEVRAAASLNHPHVVAVYDHGRLDPDEAAALGLEMDQGTPWLAMELCDRGTLQDRGSTRTWPLLRLVLLQLLDALAHAHARGVVHRDLKPSNVLFTGDPAQVKLSDFGLVFAVRPDADQAERPLYGGTPRYMAPEQVDGAWRDQGPWTDLYSLGCLAWRLATGKPPFHGPAPEVMLAHRSHAPPAFVPRFPVPEGFEAWLRRLMRKSPRDRFRFAADAAWALVRLGAPARTAAPAHEPDEVLAQLSTLVDKPPTVTLDLHETDPGIWSDPDRDRPVRHPLPADWRRVTTPPPPVRLHGVGLGLYGLREISLVGRQAERDRLWVALSEVTRDHRPRAAVIRGPDGAGRSRLARWLLERAHEVAAASHAVLLHSRPPGPRDGLVGMVQRMLRSRDLGRGDVARRIRQIAADMPAEQGLDLVDWVLDPGEGRTAFPERQAIIRLLQAHARDRPVVLLVEDAPWGPESIAFVAELLDHFIDMPVLAVLTAGVDDELPMLAGRPEVSWIDLPPLAPDEMRRLVRDLLGVKPEVAAMVEARCEGNPMFAVQLVGDWVARGLMTVSDEAFDLRGGHVPKIPDALHETWGSRVQQALAGRADPDRFALERAAVLGRTVARADWEAACGDELWASRNLLELLAREGLVVLDDEGTFTFAHQLLVESLVRDAEDAGRGAGHRAAVVETRLVQARERSASGRFAHAVASLRGIEPVLGAVEPGLGSEGFRLLGTALRHLGRLDEAHDHLERALAMAPDDTARALAGVALGLLDLAAGRSDRGHERLQHALAASAGGGAQGACLAALGRAHHAAGRLDEAADHLDAALALHRALGARRLEAEALRGKARLAHDRGDLDGAVAAYTEALRIDMGLENLIGQARDLAGLGPAYADAGDRRRAAKSYRAALDLFRRCGARAGAAGVLLDQARMDRERGRLGRAADLFDQAGRLFGRVGDPLGSLAVAVGRAVLFRRTGRADDAARVRAETMADVCARHLDGSPPPYEPRVLRQVRRDWWELSAGG